MDVQVGKGRVVSCGDDWCHVCGERGDAWWVVWPDNAEHDKPLTHMPKRPWDLRICLSCAKGIVAAMTGRPQM